MATGYTPNPLDDTQPDEGVFAGTAAAEFRAMKTVLATAIVGNTYEGEWAGLTGPLLKGDFVTHTDAMWLLKVNLADVTTVEPTLANSATWFRFTQVSVGGFVQKTSDTGSALLPVGTTLQEDTPGAKGAIRFDDDADELKLNNGADWVPIKKKLRATLSTASGGALVEHNTVPDNIDAIDLVFENVSLSGAGHVLVQIGPTAAIANTGYTDCRAHAISSSAYATDTSVAGFIVRIADAARLISGLLQLRRVTGNKWAAAGHFTTSAVLVISTGTKDLAADQLTRVGVIPSAGNFDSGVVSVFY